MLSLCYKSKLTWSVIKVLPMGMGTDLSLRVKIVAEKIVRRHLGPVDKYILSAMGGGGGGGGG